MKYNLKKSLLFLSILMTTGTFAQVKIGDNATTIDNSAVFEVESSNKGILIPRIALTSTNSSNPVQQPTESLLVYNTATNNDVVPGFYFWNGNVWSPIVSTVNNNTSWSKNGNSGTDSNINFVGTTDNKDLVFKTNNTEGYRVTADGKVIVTNDAKVNGLLIGKGLSNNSSNTVLGLDAFQNDSSNLNSTAIGYNSLNKIQSATHNTALGTNTLSNIIGNSRSNTALGTESMEQSVSASSNTAVGVSSLRRINGNNNIGIGWVSLGFLSSGTGNIGIGHFVGDETLTNANKSIFLGGRAGFELGNNLNNVLVFGSNDSTNSNWGYPINNVYIRHDSSTLQWPTMKNGLRIENQQPTSSAFVIKGAPSQNGNLLELQNNSEANLLTVTPNGSLKMDAVGSDVYLKVPVGASFTGTPEKGMIRFNTTSNKFEGYDGVSWVALN